MPLHPRETALFHPTGILGGWSGLEMGTPSSESETIRVNGVWGLIEDVLRPKFRFAARGAVEDKEEAEFREAVAETYAIVQRRMEDPSADPIQDLEAFAATTAYNVFKGMLKRKYPVRHKLALEMRTTLSLDPRLAYWSVRRLTVGGRDQWKGRGAQMSDRGKMSLEDPHKAARSCFGNRAASSLLSSDLLLTFYDWLHHPFGYDSTVQFCFQALNLRELEVGPVPEAAAEIADPSQGSEDSAEGQALAQFIWQQVLELETSRRGIFLLFEPPGENQEAICDRLLVHGVCTPRDIAAAVGMTLDQYAVFRQEERATYDLVGALYGVSPKQAENIRRGVTDLFWRRLATNGYREDKKT
jgi:hypothetical protein